MQSNKNLPYLITGGVIIFFMLLYSIVLMEPVKTAGIVAHAFDVPVLIIIVGNTFLNECRDEVVLLDKRGWQLWMHAAILVGVVEAVILLVRQFPVEMVICEPLALVLAMMYLLAKDYLGSIREQMQGWHKHITWIAGCLALVPYCALIVLQVPIAPYAFMVTEAAAVAICMHFLKKYQALLTKEM